MNNKLYNTASHTYDHHIINSLCFLLLLHTQVFVEQLLYGRHCLGLGTVPARSTPGSCPRVVSLFFSSWLKVLAKYMLSVHTCGHGKPKLRGQHNLDQVGMMTLVRVNVGEWLFMQYQCVVRVCPSAFKQLGRTQLKRCAFPIRFVAPTLLNKVQVQLLEA